MKKRSPLSPRQLIIYAVIIILCTIAVLLLFGHGKDQKEFSELSRRLFTAEMTSNTLNMHYTLAYPENFGITSYEPTLPAYGVSTPDDLAALDETLDALRRICPTHLTERDAYTCNMLTRLLENSRQLKSFSYYSEPLSPISGAQSQLPILLAEYTFRTRRDVEDYLALLDQTDAYFASLLAYEQEKAASGLSMSQASLHQTRKQCDTIVTKQSLQNGTHFLQTTFRERLDELCTDGVITSQEAAEYIAQNDRLLRTVLQPAYEALADGLFLMEDDEGADPLPTGLASLPQGREYYQALLVSYTGSNRSPEDILALLQATLQEEYTTIRTLMKQNPLLEENLAAGKYRVLPCQDTAQMLTDLQSRMKQDFPWMGEFPEVSVKKVSESLEDFCAPAFYLTTPADDTDNNVIYINEKDTSSSLERYTTLAHEGYPGHLYQTVYDNRRSMEQGENNVRHILWYGGYLEGWALYVEFYGYDYASRMLEEQGRTDDALCVRLEKHNRSLLLCLYSILDIMIHYENASREDVAQMLSGYGISSMAAVNAVYSYIADEPCNYLKYYLGYLEILELKKTARELWGDMYSDYSFHSFLLDAGPSDFTALQELLGKTAAHTPKPKNTQKG